MKAQFEIKLPSGFTGSFYIMRKNKRFIGVYKGVQYYEASLGQIVFLQWS